MRCSCQVVPKLSLKRLSNLRRDCHNLIADQETNYAITNCFSYRQNMIYQEGLDTPHERANNDFILVKLCVSLECHIVWKVSAEVR